jgi:hypothetical protein
VWAPRMAGLSRLLKMAAHIFSFSDDLSSKRQLLPNESANSRMRRKPGRALRIWIEVIEHSNWHGYTEPRRLAVRFNHVHVKVRDLPAAIHWVRSEWGIEPDFADTRMASIPLGSGTLIFDAADMDTFATIGFETEDCPEDCARLVERGATILDGPTDRPWGARTAYTQGPGELRFELEQVLGGSR